MFVRLVLTYVNKIIGKLKGKSALPSFSFFLKSCAKHPRVY